MSKENILEYFKDINHAYNDCTKYDTLKRMLDELQDPLTDATKYFNTIYELSQTLGVSYDFIDEKIKETVMATKALKQEPCEDCISRQAAIDTYKNLRLPIYPLEELPSVKPEQKREKQILNAVKFAEWVAEEIFDDNWEYNKDAFAELACRKLEKLGIVRAKGDEWELIEPQAERSDKE